MAFTTEKLFLEDSYLSTVEAKVVGINDSAGDRSGIILDRTIFYATSGGQPGDNGFLERANGEKIEIATTVYGENRAEIVHVPQKDQAEGQSVPEIGETVIAHIDWQRRHKLMQMHSACHVLSVVCPYPVTSANVGENESRIDFDLSEPVDKAEITAKMMEIINSNHPIWQGWVSEAELDANPGLVKSKNVTPPRGMGDIRLVYIGETGDIDSQPCGGTHVSETAEIGSVYIGKIEKKGKENRRFRIRFGEMPAS